MIGGLINSGIKAGMAIFSGIKQNKIAKEQLTRGEKNIAQANALRSQNPFERSEDINSLLSDAEAGAYGTSALYKMKMDSADRSLGNTMHGIKNYATSGAQALAMTSQAQSTDNIARAEAVESAYLDQERKKNELAKARQLSGEYSDQEWQQNINVPYLQKLNWGQQEVAAGMQGKANAFSNMMMGVSAAGDTATAALSDEGGLLGKRKAKRKGGLLGNGVDVAGEM